MTRCVILDDYQRVAIKAADWRGIKLDVAVYDRHFETEECGEPGLECARGHGVSDRNYLNSSRAISIRWISDAPSPTR